MARFTIAKPPTEPAQRGRAKGKAERKRVSRAVHADWSAPPGRPDPIALLEHDTEDRLEELLPIRYKRMSASPFAFYRGSAAIMASDLQSVPHTAIRTQICGDAHLANFGAYASPERRIVFDVNDFDETIEGCWEWDLKRLCASVAILGGVRGFRRRVTEAAVAACARSYREHMHAFAEMPVLDVWYARIDESALPANDPARASQALYARTVSETDGARRIVDRPPRVFHPPDAEAFAALVRDAFARYVRSLSFERQRLLRRYAFVDAAYRVVGVGSVGTRCAVALLESTRNDPLFLQLKEARASVYARYGNYNPFKNEGERVVLGQRLMQATSDLFLGWTRAKDGHTYYVRQLRDMKIDTDLETIAAGDLATHATLCAWALAKSGGDPAAIAGYLGSSDTFDRAMVAFSHAYAKQNEADYGALVHAIASGRIAT